VRADDVVFGQDGRLAAELPGTPRIVTPKALATAVSGQRC
jgi:hypothetical protein